MKQLPLKLLCLLILAGILILEGCGTQTKFASSFGKRRYEKGFYWNIPKDSKNVAARNNRVEPLSPISSLSATLSIAKTNKDINRSISPPTDKAKDIKKDIARITPNGAQLHQAVVSPRKTTAINSHHEAEETHSSKTGSVFLGAGLLILGILLIAIAASTPSAAGFLSAAGAFVAFIIGVGAIVVGIILILLFIANNN